MPSSSELTGCRVVYDNYSSDAELETRLATGGGAYDVVFPSDRAMPALLAKSLLGRARPSRLPNVRHLDAKFLRPPFDPANRFSVPYFWGTLAVGIRTDRVTGPVRGFEVLFDPAISRANHDARRHGERRGGGARPSRAADQLGRCRRIWRRSSGC